MIVLLKKRGTVTLQVDVIYEIQMFPCVIYVPQIVIIQQADNNLFNLPNTIVFSGINRAKITKKYIRVSEDVRIAIKKDEFVR